jgi:hypothetical protein
MINCLTREEGAADCFRMFKVGEVSAKEGTIREGAFLALAKGLAAMEEFAARGELSLFCFW